jgi:hypothetical protein
MSRRRPKSSAKSPKKPHIFGGNSRPANAPVKCYPPKGKKQRMLKTVEFTNYRGFSFYSMEGLCHVNLLVGKNNGGKTSVLEGIQLLASKGDPKVLSEVANRRGELIPGANQLVMTPFGMQQAMSNLVDITHFFNGHSLCLDCDFLIAGSNGYEPVSVKTAEKKPQRTNIPEQLPPQPSGYALEIKIGSNKPRQLGAISQQGGINLQHAAPATTPGFSRRQVPEVQFIGPNSLNREAIANRWNECLRSGRDRDVVKALQILDDELLQVHFESGQAFPSKSGIIAVRKFFEHSEERVPFGSLGDGMYRMLAIAVVLASAANGVVLLDEIDTALHYKIMPDLWKLVVTSAKASNVQVFATTHSWDCISGLSKCLKECKEYEPLVSIQGIDRRIDHSVVFTGEMIPNMVESDIDPR